MMKTAALLAGAAAASANVLDADVSLFQDWKAMHGREYKSDAHEFERFSVFKKNAAFVNAHNMKNTGFTLALNHFADMTHDEYKSMLKHTSKPVDEREGSTFLGAEGLTLPETVDWRTEGYVTPVKQQGDCGSCWAFSSVASLEGQYFKKTGTLRSFSEQQLIDCAGKFGNNGCNGGEMGNAFEYLKTVQQGDDLEASYPYMETEGRCQPFSGHPATPPARVTGYVRVTSGSEDALTKAIATVGPVSVAIDASNMKFMFYHSGIYVDDECRNSPEDLNHAVTAVGYGDGYFLLKNSWGSKWGTAGFGKFARNNDNMCGVANDAVYPLL